MKVAVFGGSGKVGHLVVAELLARGWEVVAYTRNPARLRIAHVRLKVVAGQLDDRDAVAEAVRGCAAVISALGPGFATWSLAIARGIDTIIGAMKEQGISRFIVLATPSYRDPRDGRDPINSLVVSAVHVLRPVAWRTIAEIGRSVSRSGLEWTLVRVLLLSNRPDSGPPRVGWVGDPGVRHARVPRATVAEFLVEQVESPKYLHGAPVISRGADSRK